MTKISRNLASLALLFATAAALAAPPERATARNQFRVTDYGTVADDAGVDTVAIQKTIDACARARGGTVVVPSGKFVSGTLYLKNGVMLHLAEDAVLEGSSNPADYAPRTRLRLHLEWRPGDTVSATDWAPAMEKLWSHATIRVRLWLNRGDVGFGQEAILAWREQAGEKRPKYLFKLRLTTNVRRAIAKVPSPLWEGVPTLGCQQLAETAVKLHGWSRALRVVIVRTLKPVNPSPQDEFWDTPEDDVAAYVTNLEKGEATPEQLALL
jgi:hypothetical protein